MSTQRDLVLARISHTRAALNEVIDHLTQDMMSWAPRSGMRTVAGQLVEIAATELQILARLNEGRFVSDDEVRDQIGAHEDFETLKAFLSQVRSATVATIAGLTDEELAEAVDIQGWHESIGLPRTPRTEIFISVAQHESYHTGQLVSYLWAKGDDPYAW